MLIKICGLRDVELATQTAQAGAHFIGLVFHPVSKRFVTLDKAKAIALATKQAGAIPVAVFVDHSALQMQEICEATDITTVQLHGNMARSQHLGLPKKYTRIYVQTSDMQQDVYEGDPARDFLLFDHRQAGSGQTFDWENFSYAGKFRWFLAGGLTPDNVSMAAQQLQPMGVDVSSGVENETGEKQLHKIKTFIQRARG